MSRLLQTFTIYELKKALKARQYAMQKRLADKIQLCRERDDLTWKQIQGRLEENHFFCTTTHARQLCVGLVPGIRRRFVEALINIWPEDGFEEFLPEYFGDGVL